MPNPTAILLLSPAERPIRPALPDPRLARGGSCCRVLTTTVMLAEIGEASAPVTAVQALAYLSAAARVAVLETAA